MDSYPSSFPSDNTTPDPGALHRPEKQQSPESGDDKDQMHSSKKISRRPVACKNCHSLKVKCTPSDENDPSSPCVRCLSTKKKCEINLNQPRKRRKKAEIEEERERLRLASEGGKANLASSVSDTSRSATPRKEDVKVGNLGGGTPTCGLAGLGSYVAGDQAQPPKPNATADQADLVTSLQNQINQLQTQVEYYRSKSSVFENKPDYVQKEDLQHELKILSKNSGACFMKLSNDLKEAAAERVAFIYNQDERLDLISQGVISTDEAERRLNVYRTMIFRSFPYIDVDDNITAQQFAENEPYFFNAVMAVASVVMDESDSNKATCQRVEIEATRHLLMQVAIAGNKTEELLKAVMLLGIWYNTPELVKHRRFHLLNALSISMLHDLGIVAKVDDKKPMLADHLMTLQQTKIVMLLYISTVSTCLILRRTVYVQWTPYVEECCKFLDNSGQKDLVNLATFSRLNHLLEKVHNVIHCSDNNTDSNIATNYILKDFSAQLMALRVKISEDDHAVLAYYYAVEAYLHEPLLSQVTGINEEGGQVFFKEEAIRSIAKSTRACIKCLEEFSKLGPTSIATLPLVYASRMIYTAGILLRLRYLILSVPLRIDKSLMPVNAIMAVQKSNTIFIEASKTYKFNFFLKKTSLMLQLFIQIYANQVQGLLKSQQHEFTGFEEPEDEIASYLIGNRQNMGGDESVALQGSRVSLDVLSYAASLKKELLVVNELSQKVKRSASNGSSPTTTTGSSRTPTYPNSMQSGQHANHPTPSSAPASAPNMFNGIGGTNSPFHNNTPSRLSTSETRFSPAANNYQDTMQPPPNQQFSQPQGSTQVPNQPPNIQNQNIHMVDASTGSNGSPASALGGSSSFFGVPGFEELDQSLYNIGEEYWGDIVNPTSNNFNLEGKGVPSNDVFFMT